MHCTDENSRFAARKLRTFFVQSILVWNNFQEEGHVTAGAFRADTFDPNMFAFLYFTWVGQGIVQKNLYALRARIDQSTHGPVLKKPRKAGRNARIIPTNFISHQQACGWSTLTGSLQAVLGLKQDGAGMRGEHANDNGFEFLKLVPWNRTLFNLQLGGEKTTQRVALVNCKSANDAARIRDAFEPFSLAGRQPHSNPPLQGRLRIECAESTGISSIVYFIT